MGMGAASSTAEDLWEQGASKGQILAGAGLSGVAEALFEEISLDRLLSEKTLGSFKELVVSIVKQGGVEASEEAFTELANIASDTLVRGNTSDLVRLYDSYLEEYDGDEEKAFLSTLETKAEEVGLAAAGGFLSGAGMGSVYDTVNYHNSTIARSENSVNGTVDAIDFVNRMSVLSAAAGDSGAVAQLEALPRSVRKKYGLTRSFLSALAEDAEIKTEIEDASRRVRKKYGLDAYASELIEPTLPAPRLVTTENVVNGERDAATKNTSVGEGDVTGVVGENKTAPKEGTAEYYTEGDTNKKDGQVTQVSDAYFTPDATSETNLPSPMTANDSISENGGDVNGLNENRSTDEAKYRAAARVREKYNLDAYDGDLAAPGEAGEGLRENVVDNYGDVENVGQNENTPGEGVNEDFENLDTTSIKFRKKNEYTPEQARTVQEYLDSVNEEIADFATRVNSDKNAAHERHTISHVSERQAKDAKELLGIDFSGYVNAVDNSGIKHIKKHHGENGLADRTMRNVNDIARVGYILDTYDSVEIARESDGSMALSFAYRDKNNDGAPKLKYSKKIDGTYYVVMAYPDSTYHKVWLVSAYTSKKGGKVTQVADVQNAPHLTSKNDLPSPYTANDSISESGKFVNPRDEDISVRDKKYRTAAEKYTAPDTLDAAATARTGRAYGASPTQIAEAQAMSELFGTPVIFGDPSDVRSVAGINAKYDRENGMITLNPESDRIIWRLSASEMTHAIEETAEYAAVREFALSHIAEHDSEGRSYEQIFADKKRTYEAHEGRALDDEYIRREIVEEFAGQYLFDDVDMIKKFVSKAPKGARRVMAWLDRVLMEHKATSRLGRLIGSDLRHARENYAAAIREVGTKHNTIDKNRIRRHPVFPE